MGELYRREIRVKKLERMITAMKTCLKVWILALCLLLLTVTTGFATERETIFVVTESWAYCTQEDGTGLYFDLLRLVYEPLGMVLNTRIMPYSRAVATVSNKAADIVIGLYEEEAEGVIYPEVPFSADAITVLYKSPTVFLGAESLEGKNVVFIRGYSYDAYILVPMQVNELASRDQAVNMILAGRADFFVDNYWDTTDTLLEMGLAMEEFHLRVLKLLPMYMVFADTEKGHRLAALFDEHFAERVRDGSVFALFQAYEMEEEYEDLLLTYPFLSRDKE